MDLVVVEVDEDVDGDDEAVECGGNATSGPKVHHLHQVSVVNLCKLSRYT